MDRRVVSCRVWVFGSVNLQNEPNSFLFIYDDCKNKYEGDDKGQTSLSHPSMIYM